MARVPLRNSFEQRIYESAGNYLDGTTAGVADSVAPRDFARRLREQRGCDKRPELVTTDGQTRYSPWRGQPWLTPVIGSGPLALPGSFRAKAPTLPDDVVEVLRNCDGWNACDQSTGADPEIWVRRYITGLTNTRIGSIEVAGTADAEDSEVQALSFGNDEGFKLAALLILTSALVTRTFHRISLDTTRVLGRWGSEYAELDAPPGMIHDRLSDLERDYLTPLNRVCGDALDALAASQERHSDRSRQQMDRALGNLIEEIQRDASRRRRVRIHYLQQLTEASWLYLVRGVAGDAYSGWTDLLLRLVLTEKGPDAAGHTRPRWGEMAKLSDSVKRIMSADASRAAGSRHVKEQAEDDAFYDAVAEVLWAEAAVHADLGGGVLVNSVPRSVCFVTSFDSEVEHALYRTALRPPQQRAAGCAHERQSFSALVPVYVKGEDDVDGEFAWLEAQYEIGTDAENWSADTTKWQVVGLNRDPDSWPLHPFVVHLMGCPLIDLPDLVESAPDTTSLVEDLRENGITADRLELVHAIALDESQALRQGDIEYGWLQGTESKKKGLPERFFDVDTLHGARRFWTLMGVPLRDDAVRARTLSVLMRPENDVAEKNPLKAGGARRHAGLPTAPLSRQSPDGRDEPEDAQESVEPTNDEGWEEEEEVATAPRGTQRAFPAGEAADSPQSGRDSSRIEAADPTPLSQDPQEAAEADGQNTVKAEPLPPQQPLGLMVSTRVDDVQRKLLAELRLHIVLDRAEAFSESLAAYATELCHAHEQIKTRLRERP